MALVDDVPATLTKHISDKFAKIVDTHPGTAKAMRTSVFNLKHTSMTNFVLFVLMCLAMMSPLALADALHHGPLSIPGLSADAVRKHTKPNFITSRATMTKEKSHATGPLSSRNLFIEEPQVDDFPKTLGAAFPEPTTRPSFKTSANGAIVKTTMPTDNAPDEPKVPKIEQRVYIGSFNSSIFSENS